MHEKSEFGYTTYGGWTFCEFVDFQTFIYVYIYIYLGGAACLPVLSPSRTLALLPSLFYLSHHLLYAPPSPLTSPPLLLYPPLSPSILSPLPSPCEIVIIRYWEIEIIQYWEYSIIK